jgi:predicted glycogen debranching enzyme
MSVNFGREICGDLNIACSREWLVTNGIGGYASGTVAGILTRRYHGLLVAALQPPLGRTLLLAKLDETVSYDRQQYSLYTNRWVGEVVDPHGYLQIESFALEGTIPTWRHACADALLEKRIWMEQGKNTSYISYYLHRASAALTVSIKALVNYRDYHSDTVGGWQMHAIPVDRGVCVTAYSTAVPFYLFCDRGNLTICHNWYKGFDLAMERYRGLRDREDHLHIATFEATLQPGESLTIIASTESQPNLQVPTALEARHTHERALLKRWQTTNYLNLASKKTPSWINQLVLAADQFIVSRPIPDRADGKTILAGYHWFSDWGRDTMISLPGLTLATGRPEIARSILLTFARYLDSGMLPNRFPDAGETPEYNTVDATLWYFEAIRAYHATTRDDDLLRELYPALQEIIAWHQRGTRYNIHLDRDGLIYAGEIGSQLTWMDAKVDDWVVTPRMGKPVEINALWYNALQVMVAISRELERSESQYAQMAEQTAQGFQRFWNQVTGYCYDVLDTPTGDDDTLRPNQIFAVSLPTIPLLTTAQQRAVVDTCARHLLTSHGLRSLAPGHPQYQGHYGGGQYDRDGAYHQGTTWGWLIGAFVQAHLKVYGDYDRARSFLQPMANHLVAHGMGSLSEIFDGDAPMTPRGCIAQAWTVAEVLRAWLLVGNFDTVNR